MQLPQGVTIAVDGSTITVKGPKGSVEKKYDTKRLLIEANGSEVTVKTLGKKSTRPLKAASGAVESHLRNMVKGVQEGFEVKLALVYSHFPVTIEVKGDNVLIKNFLGEKTPRTVRIRGKVKVEAKGQDIMVTGINKEDVGQTASNMIAATSVGHRDERVFQDGIYYT